MKSAPVGFARDTGHCSLCSRGKINRVVVVRVTSETRVYDFVDGRDELVRRIPFNLAICLPCLARINRAEAGDANLIRGGDE